jgi:phosphoribosyl 1,2-cyclic phosphate phosphodiesterase
MTNNLKITILGTGSSGGVPRVGGDWGACDPKNSKNRRRRCSVIVEFWQGDKKAKPEERTRILVDTSPDLREQLLDADVKTIDALLFTHEHGDQTNGMDDLRAIAYRERKQIPTYMDENSKNELLQRFRYCFEKPEGRIHPPILDLQPTISAGQKLEIEGVGGVLNIDVFEVGHGNINSLGFRFGERIAYTPDAHSLETHALGMLDEIDVWIVDALRYQDHPTHAHADKTLRWGAMTRAKQLVFTNMHIDMDYDTLVSELPGDQMIGYDGLEITRTY